MFTRFLESSPRFDLYCYLEQKPRSNGFIFALSSYLECECVSVIEKLIFSLSIYKTKEKKLYTHTSNRFQQNTGIGICGISLSMR